MAQNCWACGQRPADTEDGWTPLCEQCLERAGDPVQPGDRVVCRVDENASGTVVRIVDENMAVVRTTRDPEAWLPIGDLIRVL